jgi:hypothetical protein
MKQSMKNIFTFILMSAGFSPVYAQITGAITHAVAPNLNNGAINITVAGRYPPFTFNWTREGGGFNAVPEDINGLPPGRYTVVVNDAICGCPAPRKVAPKISRGS